MLRKQIANRSGSGKAQRGSTSTIEIRYESRSFSVRCLVSLAYRKGLVSRVNLSIVVPQAIGISLYNRIGDFAGEFLVIFPLGVFISIQCFWISLISLFLSRVWGHVFLVVSDRSKFCLRFSVYLLFLSLFLPVHKFWLHSRMYTWVLLGFLRIYAGFLHTVTYAMSFSF